MSVTTDLIIDDEIPSGDIDGANKVFTLAKAPNPENSIELFLNGKLQIFDVDFTVYNKTITFITAPWKNSILKINYRYVDIAELYLTIAKIIDAGLLAAKDTADFATDVDGAQKPANNATKNEGALADLDTADFATKVSGAQKPANNATNNEGALADKDAVDTAEIVDNAVNADKISVTTLSAISANIGTVTSGTVIGLLFQTSASANIGVKISSTIGGIAIYGQTLKFYDTGGVLRGYIYGSSSEGGSIRFSSPVAFDADIADVANFVGDTFMVYLAVDALIVEESLRINIAPTAEANTATHYVTININGTNYKLLLKSI